MEFNFNEIEQVIQNGTSGNAFFETIGATFFGFFLSEGWSFLKERKRIKKAGRSFFLEIKYLTESLKGQIDAIDEYLPEVDSEKIEFTGSHLKIYASLDTSSLINISKDDISKHIKRFNSKINAEVLAKGAKTIFLNLELIKFEYNRITNEMNKSFSEGETLAQEFQDALNALSRTFSSLIVEEERKGNDISVDRLLIDLHQIIKPFLDNLEYSNHSKVYKEILLPIAKTLADHRKDPRTDQFKSSLLNSIEAHKKMKRSYSNLNRTLDFAKGILEKRLEILNDEIMKMGILSHNNQKLKSKEI